MPIPPCLPHSLLKRTIIPCRRRVKVASLGWAHTLPPRQLPCHPHHTAWPSLQCGLVLTHLVPFRQRGRRACLAQPPLAVPPILPVCWDPSHHRLRLSLSDGVAGLSRGPPSPCHCPVLKGTGSQSYEYVATYSGRLVEARLFIRQQQQQ